MDKPTGSTGEIWAQAASNFASLVREYKSAIFVALALWVSGSIAYGFFEGWKKVMEEAVIFACYTVLPVVTFALVTFLWNLWLAPTRLVLREITSNAGHSAGRWEPSTPNFNLWKHADKATIYEIACLCVGEDPLVGSPSDKYRPYAKIIMDGVDKGKIRRADGRRRQTRAESAYGRAEYSTYYGPLAESADVIISDVCDYFRDIAQITEFCKAREGVNPPQSE